MVDDDPTIVQMRIVRNNELTLCAKQYLVAVEQCHKQPEPEEN
jgi:hypothetical protein